MNCGFRPFRGSGCQRVRKGLWQTPASHPGVAGLQGLEFAGHGRLRARLRHLQPGQFRLREGATAAHLGDQVGTRPQVCVGGGGELLPFWLGLCPRGAGGFFPSAGRVSGLPAMRSSGRSGLVFPEGGLWPQECGHCGGKLSRAVGCPAWQPSSPSGPQAGGRTRGSHPRGRQQAGPAAAALRASARAGRPGAPGLALRLPRVLREVQLARAASFPRAAALRFGASAPCASGPAPAGGAAPRALQPHVTELDDDADGWVGGWFDWNNRVPGLDEIAQLLSDWTGQSLLPDWMRKPPTQFPGRQDSL